MTLTRPQHRPDIAHCTIGSTAFIISDYQYEQFAAKITETAETDCLATQSPAHPTITASPLASKRAETLDTEDDRLSDAK